MSAGLFQAVARWRHGCLQPRASPAGISMCVLGEWVWGNALSSPLEIRRQELNSACAELQTGAGNKRSGTVVISHSLSQTKCYELANGRAMRDKTPTEDTRKTRWCSRNFMTRLRSTPTLVGRLGLVLHRDLMSKTSQEKAGDQGHTGLTNGVFWAASQASPTRRTSRIGSIGRAHDRASKMRFCLGKARILGPSTSNLISALLASYCSSMTAPNCYGPRRPRRTCKKWLGKGNP
ncbi:hypothetical protein QBC34DRAFT_195250 [Podospora aff. communis PSN243]|uniref:Uncharacterized protein n=1 Tax=Podospora aff. communis PSN243 TaxID=3040156 RepID=A0AAV9G7B7_9PEZI|nr:hypothetical protein QBC34DRAFT_195250 [Podospora aff. communis PSN243]